MHHFIHKTEQLAYTYFKAFSFQDTVIKELLEIAIKEVKYELKKVEELIEAEYLDKEALHSSFHALKGVLSQLGNHEIIRQIEAIETSSSDEEIHQKSLCLFFIQSSAS
jgi:hypothetical protein